MATKKKFIIIASCILCNINLYSQFSQQTPSDEAFRNGYTNPVSMSTEMINGNTKIDIYRTFGVPRYGIVNNSSGQTFDTIWYFASNVNKWHHTGYFVHPQIIDNAITVYSQSPFAVKIMDVMNGDIVFEQFGSAPASDFIPDTNSTGHLVSITNNGVEIDSNSAEWQKLKEEYYTQIGKSELFNFTLSQRAEGKTINYSDIPSGLYFIFIMENNEVMYMKTIRKDM